MSFLKLYVMYLFKYIIIPLWVICLIGKPLFLLRIISKILKIKIQNHEIFNMLLFIYIILVLYYGYISYQAKSDIKTQSESLNIESKLLTARSSERNVYIFINSIAMLITMHKLTERYERLDNEKKKLKNIENELNKLIPEKSAEDKKKD